MILKWKNCPGLFRWALNTITNVLVKESRRKFKTEEKTI
jgi:hypothetical protein